jgi:hypothetical protein
MTVSSPMTVVTTVVTGSPESVNVDDDESNELVPFDSTEPTVVFPVDSGADIVVGLSDSVSEEDNKFQPGSLKSFEISKLSLQSNLTDFFSICIQFSRLFYFKGARPKIGFLSLTCSSKHCFHV